MTKFKFIFLTAILSTLIQFIYSQTNNTQTLQNNTSLASKNISLKWDSIYRFDKFNSFAIDTYDSTGILRQHIEYRTGYTSTNKNFIIERINDKQHFNTQSLIDETNGVALQTFFYNGGEQNTLTVSKFYIPGNKDLKKLYLFATKETKIILGMDCKKFDFEYRNTKGSFWICQNSTISNNLGVFRASKLQGVFNTLSENGFVMEVKMENEKHITTIMNTTNIAQPYQYEIFFRDFKINMLNNAVNYYIY